MTKRINLYIPDPLYDHLMALSDEHGVSVNEIARMFLVQASGFQLARPQAGVDPRLRPRNATPAASRRKVSA